MSNTYTQLIIQLVFAVKGRKSFISETWEEELYKYITAVVQYDRHNKWYAGSYSYINRFESCDIHF